MASQFKTPGVGSERDLLQSEQIPSRDTSRKLLEEQEFRSEQRRIAQEQKELEELRESQGSDDLSRRESEAFQRQADLAGMDEDLGPPGFPTVDDLFDFEDPVEQLNLIPAELDLTLPEIKTKARKKASTILNQRTSKRLIGGDIEPSQSVTDILGKDVIDPVTGLSVAADEAKQKQINEEYAAAQELGQRYDLTAEETMELYPELVDDKDGVEGLISKSNTLRMHLLSFEASDADTGRNYTSMDEIRQLTGMPMEATDVELSNVAMESFLTVAEGAFARGEMGQILASTSNTELVEDASEFFNDSVGDTEADGLVLLDKGGIEKNSFRSLLASQLRLRSTPEPVINAQGLAVDPTNVPTSNYLEAADIIIANLKRAGYLSEGLVKTVPEGTTKEIKGPNESVQAIFVEGAYPLVRSLRQYIRGRNPATVVKKAPVTPGGRIGAMRALQSPSRMNQDPAKFSKEQQRYLKIMNSIGLFADPQMTYMLQVMNLAVNSMENNTMPAEFAELFSSFDKLLNRKLTTIDTSNFTEADLKTYNMIVADRAREVSFNISDFAEILQDGLAVYPEHVVDYLNGRLRNIEMTINPTNYKVHRAAVRSAQPTNIQLGNRDNPKSFRYLPSVPGASIIPQAVMRTISARYKGIKGKPDYSPLSDAEREASFVLQITRHVLQDLTPGTGLEGGGTDPSGFSLERLAEYATPELLLKAAKVGAVLKKVFPDYIDNKAILQEGYVEGTQGLTSLSPEERQILEKAFGSMDREDFGFKAKAYILADDYIGTTTNENGGTTYKRDGTLSVSLNSEFDYRSAGLTFMQMDAGRENFMNYVGVISEHLELEYRDSNAGGTPRSLFLGKIMQAAKAHATDDNYDAEIAEAMDLSLNDPAAAAALIKMAKSILLQIGYGKPSMFQKANIRRQIKNIPLLQQLNDRIGNNRDIVDDLNYLVYKSVREVIDTRFANKTKQITRYVQLLGVEPHINGPFGLPIKLGNTINVDDTSSPPKTFINNVDGDRLEVYSKTKKVNLKERARSSDNLAHFIGDQGSAIWNRVSPMMGQLRETMAIQQVILDMNEGREDNPLFAITVYDNIISNTDSFIYTFMGMNSKAAYDAFARNLTSDYLKTNAELFTKSNLEALLPTVIEISDETPYGAILEVLDNLEQRIKDFDEGKKESDRSIEELDNSIIPESKALLKAFKANPLLKPLLKSEGRAEGPLTVDRNTYMIVLGYLLRHDKLERAQLEAYAKESDAKSQALLRNIALQDFIRFAG